MHFTFKDFLKALTCNGVEKCTISKNINFKKDSKTYSDAFSLIIDVPQF